LLLSLIKDQQQKGLETWKIEYMTKYG
jgi:hypothetical protein